MKRRLFFLFWIIQGCNHRPEYTLTAVKDALITVDGVRNEKAWNDATAILSFVNPWNREVRPATSLHLLKDSASLYFHFDARDDEIVLEPLFSKERDVEKEDRVELFFSKDKDMKTYYCFEIDAKGRTLSYQASLYRKFDFNWDVPEGYHAEARIDSGGYMVEGVIPTAFLNALCPDGPLYVGAYRAEFSRKGNKIVENWLTWVDPKTAMPDFHVPATLGKIHY